MKFFRFRKKKLNKRKEGASLVSVIIGAMFLVTLGLTITTVATRYIVSVYTERNSSNNFYEAEGILTEVRTGLIGYAADASRASYEEILENYTGSKNAKKEFSEKYINKLVMRLTGKAAFDVKDELKNGKTVKLYSGDQGVPIDKIKDCTQMRDAVKPGYYIGEGEHKKGFYGFYVEYDKKEKVYSLILKGLDIDYKNDADYRSRVTTDLIFKTPDYKFNGNSTLDELKKYLTISDGKLCRSGGASAAETTLTGNIYAGLGNSLIDTTGATDKGIEIYNGMNVRFNAERIISRGSFDIYSGANVTISGESGTADPVPGDLWLQNIRIRKNSPEGSKASTTLNVYENSYVSNDLDIEDNNAKIYLAGTYYGYSYNKENILSDPVTGVGKSATDARYSSAVLVNGLNTSLFTNWDNGAGAAGGVPTLEKLVLAGHTFVERTNKSGADQADIMTGESIAAKSDQIAYMVPDDYMIGVEHNPVLPADYTEGAMTKQKFLAGVKAALLNDSAMKGYLNPAQPFLENHQSIDGMDLMYLFLNFKDFEMANKYYKDYFSGVIPNATVDEGDSTAANRELLKERAQTYLYDTNIHTTLSPNLYLLAGYIANNFDSDDGVTSPEYFDSNSRPKETLLADARKIGASYYEYCMSLTTSSAGAASMERIEDSTDRLVADIILDMSKLNASEIKPDPAMPDILVKAVDGDCPNSSDLMPAGTPASKKGILVAGGDVTVDEDFRGLIIAGGDVTVTDTFDGLIIAQGEVNVTNPVKMTADIVMISELMDYIKKDPNLSLLFRALNGPVKEGDKDLEACITYQNWQKNAEAATGEAASTE